MDIEKEREGECQREIRENYWLVTQYSGLLGYDNGIQIHLKNIHLAGVLFL